MSTTFGIVACSVVAILLLGWAVVLLAAPVGFAALAMTELRYLIKRSQISRPRFPISSTRARFFLTSNGTRSRLGPRFENEIAHKIEQKYPGHHVCACIAQEDNYSRGMLHLWNSKRSLTMSASAASPNETVQDLLDQALNHNHQTWQSAATETANCNATNCPLYWNHIHQ